MNVHFTCYNVNFFTLFRISPKYLQTDIFIKLINFTQHSSSRSLHKYLVCVMHYGKCCRYKNNYYDEFQTRYPSVFNAEITDLTQKGNFFLPNYFPRVIPTTGGFESKSEYS